MTYVLKVFAYMAMVGLISGAMLGAAAYQVSCVPRAEESPGQGAEVIVVHMPCATSAPSSTQLPSAPPTPPPAVPPKPPEEPWKAVTDMSYLAGTWANKSAGARKRHELRDGDVSVVFRKNRAGARTPWTMRFVAPKEHHRGALTVGGGCGLYTELHEHAWRTAFCKGYGLGSTSQQLRLFLERNEDGDGLSAKLGPVLDVKLLRR